MISAARPRSALIFRADALRVLPLNPLSGEIRPCLVFRR